MFNSYDDVLRLIGSNRRVWLTKTLCLQRDNWRNTWTALHHINRGPLLIYHPDRIVIYTTMDPNLQTPRKIVATHIPAMYKLRNFDGALTIFNENHKHIRIPAAQGVELSWDGFCRNRPALEPLFRRVRRMANARAVYNALTRPDFGGLITDPDNTCFICGARTEDETPLMEHMGLKYHVQEHLEGDKYVPEMLVEAIYAYLGSHRSWEKVAYKAAQTAIELRGDIDDANPLIKGFLADAWVMYIDNLLGENLRD